ncbi:MAG: GAF domain-containing protein [Candidatus Aminicenantes bacterium]
MSKTRKPDLIRREGFKSKLNENNILTKVVNGKKPIEDEDVDANLIRVFLPIQDIGKEKDKDNIVLGVVEAGFHKSTRSNISKEMRITLELFLNYCSSLFHSALKRSEKQIVENLLGKSAGIEHHEKYLDTILKDTVKLIGSDKGYILFYSLNYKEIDINDNPIFYNFNNKDKSLIKRKNELSTRIGIVRHAAETNHYYFSNDVKNDEYYIEEFEYVNSVLAVPMRYYGRIIAVINIYSTERDLFDESKANIIQIIADEAAKSFQIKKINQTIKDLVIPFQLFAGIEKIYGLILENIKDYFMTELVSIWERAEIGDEGEYKLFIARDTLKEKYAEFGIHSLKQDIFKTKREIQLLNFEHNPRDCGFNEFVGKYDLKSMIIVPIIIDQQVYGFINIFSKRELPSLFPEEITFLNLVATKGAISVQYEKLISSFMEISDSLPSENLDRILGNIAGNARRVLHADPVILFRYDQTQENFEATFSGYLFHPDIKKDLRHYKEEDHLVTYIISKGSVWFENSDDYQEYVKEIGRKHKGIHFKEDFWTREKIKSSAGVRLEHNDEPIGVMFFNYREEQSFDRDTRRFIEVFSSLASSAIVNARYLDLIEKQRKKLGEQKGQLEMQKEKLEFEYEEVYRKMKEMLPRATRTSFYQILEGINHDVRNFLIRMKQALMDVRENSERLYKRERNTINVRVKDIERNIRNVTNLLKLFNFRNPGKEAININALIEELTYFFKTRESESIHFNTKELEDRIPIITCNKAELSMIIYNLFSNAVHAIVEKNITNGEIMITTDFIYGEYIIVVEDNGVGIDNKDISHIYEAGFSRKEGGLGIGLYFIYETLRESFWGTIECESQYGQWTKFTIKIPESVNYKED